MASNFGDKESQTHEYGQLLGPLLDRFWVEGLLELREAVSGAFLAVLRFAWNAWRSRRLVNKRYDMHVFTNVCFRCPSSLVFLLGWTPERRVRFVYTIWSKKCLSCWVPVGKVLEHFGGPFWGGQNQLKERAQMGPKQNLLPPANRGGVVA